jgi:hypothetical protein
VDDVTGPYRPDGVAARKNLFTHRYFIPAPSRRRHRIRVRHAVPVPDNDWYSARCVFEFHGLAETPTYEERVTLWQAPDFETAIALAEAEAEEYAGDLCTFTGLIQAFHLYQAPGHGAEVFSLMRNSALPARDYLGTFFDTGDERMGPADAPASR